MPDIRQSDEETLARLPRGHSFPFGKTNEGVFGVLNLPEQIARLVCTTAQVLPEPTTLRVTSLGSLLFQRGPIWPSSWTRQRNQRVWGAGWEWGTCPFRTVLVAKASLCCPSPTWEQHSSFSRSSAADSKLNPSARGWFFCLQPIWEAKPEPRWLRKPP